MRKLILLLTGAMYTTALFVAPAPILADEALEDERPILISSYEYDELLTNSIEVSGRIAGSQTNIRASITSASNFYRFTITHESGDELVIEVESQLVQNLDFSTLTFHAVEWEGHVLFTIRGKFGRGNECFSNDDGRPRLTLETQDGVVLNAYETNYDSCNASYEDIEYSVP